MATPRTEGRFRCQRARPALPSELNSCSALPTAPTVSLRDAIGREDVALLAVDVMQQRDARAPVGVVFDVGDLGGHAVLVATEVHDPVPALGPPALVACRDPAVRIPSGLVTPLGDEGLLGRGAGELVEGRHARAAPARRRRLVLAN